MTVKGHKASFFIAFVPWDKHIAYTIHIAPEGNIASALADKLSLT